MSIDKYKALKETKKIGETFTFKGKKLLVVASNNCKDCELNIKRDILCMDYRESVGYCYDSIREEKFGKDNKNSVSVKFMEVK